MEKSLPMLPSGTRVRVRFGRYAGRTGKVTAEHSLLPAREPLVWVRFEGTKEQGLIAVRFLDQIEQAE